MTINIHFHDMFGPSFDSNERTYRLNDLNVIRLEHKHLENTFISICLHRILSAFFMLLCDFLLVWNSKRRSKKFNEIMRLEEY